MGSTVILIPPPPLQDLVSTFSGPRLEFLQGRDAEEKLRAELSKGSLGAGNEQPDQHHPLPSYLDYRSNSSVRYYQTSYFPSHCSQALKPPQL
ncbi:hypothetical protein INR49_007546 [Caranx melampygus]|nr:hypothetical protein INR49_007546 [Caranx melampygus]